MLTLAFDTATAAVTVAVAEGDAVLAQTTVAGARRHGEVLAPAIAEVLEQAGIDRRSLTAVAVGVGPGPFTGLRVGLMTARTLGMALHIPVLGVCTLDLLAWEAASAGLDGDFVVATDARRKEVYWATYNGDADLTCLDGPHVCAPTEVASAGPVVGEGAVLYPREFPDGREPRQPSGATLCQWVASGRPILEPLPLYLRRPDAAEPGARKPVMQQSRP